MKSEIDNIELVLPFKAEYVSIARLTVSGVANRIGFDIETIEDIKVALAEVCNKLINIGSNKVQNFRIIFQISDKKLNIVFECHDDALKGIFSDGDDEFGISIMNALMDDVKLLSDNSFILSMSKCLEGNI
jgi:serine/threonine-protein kinase RsbW